MPELRADQSRVRKLIGDTIVLLCQQGLRYGVELRIQGVVAVTVDRQDTFVVQVDVTDTKGEVLRKSRSYESENNWKDAVENDDVVEVLPVVDLTDVDRRRKAPSTPQTPTSKSLTNGDKTPKNLFPSRTFPQQVHSQIVSPSSGSDRMMLNQACNSPSRFSRPAAVTSKAPVSTCRPQKLASDSVMVIEDDREEKDDVVIVTSAPQLAPSPRTNGGRQLSRSSSGTSSTSDHFIAIQNDSDYPIRVSQILDSVKSNSEKTLSLEKSNLPGQGYIPDSNLPQNSKSELPNKSNTTQCLFPAVHSVTSAGSEPMRKESQDIIMSHAANKSSNVSIASLVSSHDLHLFTADARPSFTSSDRERSQFSSAGYGIPVGTVVNNLINTNANTVGVITSFAETHRPHDKFSPRPDCRVADSRPEVDMKLSGMPMETSLACRIEIPGLMSPGVTLGRGGITSLVSQTQSADIGKASQEETRPGISDNSKDPSQKLYLQRLEHFSNDDWAKVLKEKLSVIPKMDVTVNAESQSEVLCQRNDLNSLNTADWKRPPDESSLVDDSLPVVYTDVAEDISVESRQTLVMDEDDELLEMDQLFTPFQCKYPGCVGSYVDRMQLANHYSITHTESMDLLHQQKPDLRDLHLNQAKEVTKMFTCPSKGCEFVAQLFSEVSLHHRQVHSRSISSRVRQQMLWQHRTAKTAKAGEVQSQSSHSEAGTLTAEPVGDNLQPAKKMQYSCLSSDGLCQWVTHSWDLLQIHMQQVHNIVIDMPSDVMSVKDEPQY